MEVKSKLLVFSPVPSVIQIIQKVESVNTQSNCKATCKKDNRLVQCVYTLEKYKKVEIVKTPNDYETSTK